MDDKESPAREPSGSSASGEGLRALFVGGGEEELRGLVSAIRRGGAVPVVDHATNLVELRAALSRPWDVLLTNLDSASSPTLEESLRVARGSDPDVPILLVGFRSGPAAAAAAVRAGVSGFVGRDDLDDLLPVIRAEMASAEQARCNRRLQRERGNAAQVSAALAKAGRELIAPLDSDVLLDRLCGLLRDLLECSSSQVFLLDLPAEMFIVRASAGNPTAGHPPISPAALRPILEQLRDDDIVSVSTGASTPEPLRGLWNAKHVLAAPLRYGSDVFGLLTACCDEDVGGRTAIQGPILRGVARMASLALENARIADELARANRLKSEFVATMSHELRTPLNVVIGFNDLLLESEFGPLTDEQADVLRRVDRSAHQLLDLINATLDLSRLEAGQLRLEVADVSFPTLLRDLRLETASLHARKPGIQLDWSIAADLPVIQSDELKIRVILKNLLGNALKFTEEGKVKIRAKRSRQGIEVSVTDSGIGISPESMQEIFQPFRAVGTTNTGVGLGLYVVRRLLAELGGTIQVESKPHKGSTFRVYFPPIIGGNQDADPGN